MASSKSAYDSIENSWMRVSDLINTSTKHHHASSNRLITSRLPLCLPPTTQTPDAYLLGLSHIAELFFAFEQAWDEICSASKIPSMENTWESLETYPHPHASQEDSLITALRTLRPLGLARSTRLRNDIEYLRHTCGLGDKKEEASETIEAITQHIHDAVTENPHLLIAYAWTLYMAIFSGGRWIRGQLCGAGEDFWRGQTPATASEDKPKAPEKWAWNWRSPVARLASEKPTKPASKSQKLRNVNDLREFEANGLSLWFFPGSNDGEELRADFKARLGECDQLLTNAQREEIAAESQAIFSGIEVVIAELDDLMEMRKAAETLQTETDDVPVKEEEVVDTPKPVFDPETTAIDVLPKQPEHVEDTATTPARNERRKKVENLERLWYDLPSYAGLALVVSCVSWYAMYHAGTWS